MSKSRTQRVSFFKKIIIDELDNIILILIDNNIHYSSNDLIFLLKNLVPLDICNNDQEKIIIETSKKYLFDNSTFADDIASILEFFELFPQAKNPNDIENIKTLISELHDYDNDYDDLINNIDVLEIIKEKYSFLSSVSHSEIARMQEQLQDLEEENKKRCEYEEEFFAKTKPLNNISDYELDKMFGTQNYL